MQQMLSNRQKQNNSSNQTHTMIITAITLFALSGLIVGLAVGAFMRTQRPQTPTVAKDKTAPTATPEPTATPKTTVQAQAIGCPAMTISAYEQVAGSATTYTVTAQVRDRSGGAACSQQNKPLAVTGVTCKIWLVKVLPTNKQTSFPNDTDNLLKGDVAHLTGSLTITEAGGDARPEVTGLQFSAGTSQTQTCNNQGLGTWQYTISSQVPAGRYSLLALTDWSGYYNWSWIDIAVSQQ